MIQSVEIENLRGIAHGKLEGLTPLTVIVGPNGSGKSTILDALYIGSSDRPGPAIAEVAQRHKGTPSPNRWMLRNPATKSDGAIRVSTESAERTIYLKFHETHELVWSFNKNDGWHTGDNREFLLSGVSECHMVGVNTKSVDKNLTDVFSELEESGRSKDSELIVKFLMPKSTGLKILTDKGQPVLYVSYEDRAIPVSLSGDGIHSLIRLGLELSLKPGGVVLVEEVEVHLHPAAIRFGAKLIFETVRRGVQVIMSTHSLELIDALIEEATEPEDIDKLSLYWVKLDDAGELNSIRTPGPDVAFEREQIGKDLR